MSPLAFIVAANNDAILQKNFLNSKVTREKKYPVIIQRGYRNIGKAYNDGRHGVQAEYLVCLHQDVFLPDAWEDQVLASLRQLAGRPWGVLGVAGIRLMGRQRVLVGHILDQGRPFGSSENLPAIVDTLDELLLIVRNDGKLLFDEEIPATHLYGADICLQASSQGMGCYAINAYCHHNSINSNPDTPEFRLAAKYMQEKWKKRLPILTTCTLLESKTVENLRRIVKSLGLQALTRPITTRVMRVQSAGLAGKGSQD
jgi:hypothetical protein